MRHVFAHLMNRQCCVVRFDNNIGHFWGGDDGIGGHDSIGVFLAHFADDECTHT